MVGLQIHSNKTKFNYMLPRKPQMTPSKPQFISIQGNIGSGKSTVLKIIRQSFPDLFILDEPLSDWQNVGEKQNINLLDIYYKNPERWGFTFQIYAFMSRLKKWTQYSSEEGEGLRISERSLLSDRYVFASIMKNMDILDEAEYEIYLQFYEYMQKMKNIVSLSGIIYIRCSAEICEKRIQSRCRQGEDSIPLDYLKKLHSKHEDWLNRSAEQAQTGQIDNANNNILIIDNTQQINKEKIISSVESWIFKMKEASVSDDTKSDSESSEKREKKTSDQTDSDKKIEIPFGEA